jgi:hypothetical protein
MLSGVHFLLSYDCTYECDHCFVYSGPRAGGTFTIDQIKEVIAEARKIDTMKAICFEGGEPFMYYPVLIEGIRQANAAGFRVILVTNCYFANSDADIELYFAPLKNLGIADLSISDDSFHGDEEASARARRAIAVAERMGLPVGSICIEEPTVKAKETQAKGEPVIGGGVLFKGRAADKLTEGLPTRDWRTFVECPHEELRQPGRVHVDAFGATHICQGISMGNMWKTPLSELDARYDADAHPICGPLLKGGPAELARRYDVKLEGEYVDECHFCFNVRRQLLDAFPEHLTPRRIYGLE